MKVFVEDEGNLSPNLYGCSWWVGESLTFFVCTRLVGESLILDTRVY